ncbi:hypothetical protein T440DRAFT_461532 [Plenodomus tracheiphilus IPT5]|uniref:C2H2-type domain-containing protein n=1 Tax=Plenodomus tracheiphilus IPT5 TaxID=1408161 RepID=A0A6A7APW9_9PLEO|nr:hypothetical protein T440DRAFT_461532 [Plenodomus tracheiphilus IPT5]
MAARAQNRYALFTNENNGAKPAMRSPVDVSRNPFLNQVADDSIPWEEVKKRGAPQERRALQFGVKTLIVKDQNRATLNRALLPQTRNRAISSSTADGSDKFYDPHENWCGVCSQRFPSKPALVTHIKQTPHHQHYCNLCKRVFKDRNGLKNHVDNSWGHEISCNLCLSAFKNSLGLKNHFENNYHVGHEFACLTCLLGFRSNFELERHLQTAEKHTWCETCNRRFRTQDERDEHWQKTNRHRHCLQPGCDFDCGDHATLVQHHMDDHFQCVGCKRILPSMTKLNIHYETCASALSCPQCDEICAGKTSLAKHLTQCYLCEECGFHTHHEGNYKIHMTKHSSNNIPCWGCEAPMRTYSSLINHLESGKCPCLRKPTRLLNALGKWWYSPLYMDIDLHVQLRTGRVNLDEMHEWMKIGALQPFICRADGCMKSFAHMSSLVLHCESQACAWDIVRLNISGLEAEVRASCLRRDSVTA